MNKSLIILNASILKLAFFLFHLGNEEGVWTCKVLAVAQAQLLRAHDHELKMATARLHLRENENDTSMDALGEDELESASVLHSSRLNYQRTISTQKLKLLSEVSRYDLYYSLTHPLK